MVLYGMGMVMIMLIVEDNFNKTNETEKSNVYTCEHCKSKIQVEESDKTIGEYGLKFFDCPCCNKKSCTNESINLTKDNIEYPLHFYIRDNGDILDDKNKDGITYEIRRMCNMLWENTDMQYTFTQIHGVTIFVLNMAGEGIYDIYICKNVDESCVSANPNDPFYRKC